ncbi:hypothetical protein MMC08_002516 [Hypocenomyce scalaris]|nr:hypothetical protein [Hypocenomyce scalaris]
MNAIHNFVVRDDSASNNSLTSTMSNLLIALLAIILFGLLLIAGLFALRQHRISRQNKESELPIHNQQPGTKTSNHRRLTITAAPYGRRSEPLYVYNEKQALVDHASEPPASPVPEIRITFPEEEDDAGRRKSGRVVVVRIGKSGGVGLEPLEEEDLPQYEKSDAERFQSLDLERIGGLKEKELGRR